MSGEDKVVCVTGASGFIASWLVQRLLQRGYFVKATVRDTSDPMETQHLLALEGAKERLELFQADLLNQGDFDSAVDGCVGVFHTASPAIFESSNPQAEIVNPAVKGTLNVLKSCTKVPSIKRVIVTSSTAAVLFSGEPLTPDVLINETWYSNPEICKQYNHWYALSKTLAEEAAWKFSKEHGLDLVVINPAYVIGPQLNPTLNITVKIILDLINGGSETYPDSYFSFVVVRDVADAHIQAFEIPSANGRYVLTTGCHHYSEILKIAHQHYPTLILPRCDYINVFSSYRRTSTEKAKTLRLNFINLEESLRDTIESLKEKGFLSKFYSASEVYS